MNYLKVFLGAWIVIFWATLGIVTLNTFPVGVDNTPSDPITLNYHMSGAHATTGGEIQPAMSGVDIQ